MSEAVPVVFVVDDDASVRDGIRRFLRSEGLAVEVFASAQDFLDARAGTGTPGCLVLDVFLPGLSGLELQRQLVGSEASLPIVFLTGQGDIPMSVRAMQAGAVEFLTKPFRPQALVAAVKTAILRDRAAREQRQASAELSRRYLSLTPRERAVMAGVCAGLLNKQIAAEFGTKEMTVKEQRARVMQKMLAGSTAQLVRMAVELEIPGTVSGSTPPVRR